ncbi:MAG: uroporphyrinogen decarboxylase [Acidobacteriota bacterium]|jgi:uroporphyrinogen decarboxylase|nr:uroporphyrinogen decarboxylase [Acidobacteriota bacterium]
MNDAQWNTLLSVIRGEEQPALPVGFIIDSPWLPGWHGCGILDYFTDERRFLAANMNAVETFPEAMFLPGFWSEYGMCTEPSAFGAVTMWEENEFPFAKRVIGGPEEVERIEKPDPRKDGLLPFVIKRLKHLEPEIEAAGHKIRFAVARGPLNIASFLMGATEFMTALATDPEPMHRLLDLTTDFLVEWVAWQRECFPSIDGILLLDDMVGFVGRKDFETFGMERLAKIYDTDVSVKFFHNDAPCKACAPLLADVGINFLNFGVQHTLSEMQEWTGGKVALLGNLPPRDVLASGTPEDVARETAAMLGALKDRRRLVASCGGGMPPNVPTENIRAFIDAAAR